MFLNLCNHISWWTFGLIPVLSFVSKVAVGISYTRLRHTLALTFQISEVNILIQSTDIFLSFRKKIIAPCGLCVCSTFVSRIVVVQALSCAILCDPRGLQCASLPVLHHLLGFAQIHGHWISAVIQPAHPLKKESDKSTAALGNATLFQKWTEKNKTPNPEAQSEWRRPEQHC